MKVGVLGTGTVGRTLAARLVDLDHEIALGTRDVESTMARSEPDQMGNAPLATWAAENPAVAVHTFADAARFGEVVVNATAGSVSIDVLTAAGADNLAGKVLLDIANPLDFSAGMPPSLFVKDTDSLGEQIQQAFPGARVVKALNTMTAALMADPRRLAAGDHTTFVSGNDADAKQLVAGLLRSLGHTDVLDLGDITTARGAEMLLPIWLRIWGALGTPMFNVKVVR
ncbi:MAG: NADPH-dependent F420 reductase [Actinomycetes bacterium]